MTKKFKSNLINKKTEEAEQSSSAKIRMLPKPSPKSNRRKRVLFEICKKKKLAKHKSHVETSQFQRKKTLNNLKKKDKNY